MKTWIGRLGLVILLAILVQMYITANAVITSTSITPCEQVAGKWDLVMTITDYLGRLQVSTYEMDINRDSITMDGIEADDVYMTNNLITFSFDGIDVQGKPLIFNSSTVILAGIWSDGDIIGTWTAKRT